MQVRFWPEDEPSSSYAGYSRNISATGVFIATVHPVSPGRILQMEFQGEGYDFKLRGRVMHSAKVSPLLQSVRPSGMGIKFLDRALELDKLLPENEVWMEGEKERSVFPMYFPSPGEIIGAFERDIKNGGLFIPTTRPAEMEEDVAIEMHLPRAEDPVLIFMAKVVHRVASGPNMGMGIAFQDQEKVIEQLGPIVASFR